MVNNPLVAFQEVMRASGVFLAADAHIIPDGQLHRARAADDKAGALSIWYNFHPDAPASGAAGNWKTGARLTWCGKRLSALTASERALLSQRIEQDRRRAQEAQEARHAAASAKAIRIWTDAAPASPNHPYLLKKQIAPGIARMSRGALVLPVVDFSGALHGLQFIDEQGGKRFISGMAKQGHFIPTGKAPDGTRPLYIAEGWATAATIQAMRPNVCTIAACDAGNLPSVATAARRTWGGVPIVIAPDFDKVGQEKGREACTQVGGHWLPTPADLPTSCTDWNDWRQFQRQGVAS
jgi:putative DNA primase/helicase